MRLNRRSGGKVAMSMREYDHSGPRRPMPTPSPGPYDPDEPIPGEVPDEGPLEPDDDDEGPVL